MIKSCNNALTVVSAKPNPQIRTLDDFPKKNPHRRIKSAFAS